MTVFANKAVFMQLGLEPVKPSTGHLHGEECLSAWLDTGNSCPTCKRILFEASGREIKQSDINSVVHMLGYWYTPAQVLAAVARLQGTQELEREQLRHSQEQQAREAQETKEIQSRHEMLMEEEDWYPSGDEDFDMDNDQDEDYNPSEKDEDEDEDEEL